MKRLKQFLLLAGKIAVLSLVAHMAALQIPELAYDLSDRTPTEIASPEDLAGIIPGRPVFVAVHGRADFGDAFSYQRYGLTFTYFTLKPYGRRIVVRTHDRVTDEWTMLDRFLGKLRPFAAQPFSYRIEEIFRDRHGVRIPADAYFLALDDVPELSGWQVGAILFSTLLWGVLCYLFFFYRGTLFQRAVPPKGRSD
ncbi:MAG: hypothetical protein AB1568_10695 [Thermodesulfobacteriota bacterium]